MDYMLFGAFEAKLPVVGGEVEAVQLIHELLADEVIVREGINW